MSHKEYSETEQSQQPRENGHVRYAKQKRKKERKKEIRSQPHIKKREKLGFIRGGEHDG